MLKWLPIPLSEYRDSVTRATSSYIGICFDVEFECNDGEKRINIKNINFKSV